MSYVAYAHFYEPDPESSEPKQSVAVVGESKDKRELGLLRLSIEKAAIHGFWKDAVTYIAPASVIQVRLVEHE